MTKKDYYEVLEISRSATPAEIKKAYLKLAKKYHPDTNSGKPDSEQKFKEISQAYEVLKDEQKKAAYDRLGHAAFEQGMSGGGFSQYGARGGPDVNDMFSEFFSDFMGGRGGSSTRGKPAPAKGSDLRYNLEITLLEAFQGVDKEISYSTEVKCSTCAGRGTKDKTSEATCKKCNGHGAVRIQQGFFAIEQTCNVCRGQGQIITNPCTTCHGAGRCAKVKNLSVNIPAGIESGVKIRIAGEGEAGLRGGAVGDLYVFVTIKHHNVFKLEHSDLHFNLPLRFTIAALGGEVEIPTIEGEKIQLKIPAGTETGNKIRIKGKGMSKVRSAQRGDMYAHAYVEIPKNLTPKQRELLEELDKELGKDSSDGSFFAKMKNIWS